MFSQLLIASFPRVSILALNVKSNFRSNVKQHKSLYYESQIRILMLKISLVPILLFCTVSMHTIHRPEDPKDSSKTKSVPVQMYLN